MYFRDAGPPPAPVRYELAHLPFSEYWMGIIFNGEKIGFTHFAVRRLPGDPPRFDIRSDASFLLRFLGFEKKIVLKSHDVVHEDLSLAEFSYDYNIDGSQMQLSGRQEGGELVATIVTGGRASEQRFATNERVYPSSVIGLYPVVNGLTPGRDYRYRVYTGELQALAEVEQRVVAYEASELFAGNAFKVETSLHGQSSTSWFDHHGRPQLELTLRGVMISALEDEDSARRYLALGALNKKESLVEFSMIRPDAPIEQPRRVTALKLALSGITVLPPSGRAQRCVPQNDEIVCEIRGAVVEFADAGELAALQEKYLRPSVTVQSQAPAIRRLAADLGAGRAAPREQISGILHWLDTNVDKAPLDVLSALDVLEKRRAECQGHAYLYAALARASGIPTRVVNGLVYSEDVKGFLYHSWAESLVGSDWIGVDPTLGESPTDATHIKLVEGEQLADLLLLLEWAGRVKIRVLAVEPEQR